MAWFSDIHVDTDSFSRSEAKRDPRPDAPDLSDDDDEHDEAREIGLDLYHREPPTEKQNIGPDGLTLLFDSVSDYYTERNRVYEHQNRYMTRIEYEQKRFTENMPSLGLIRDRAIMEAIHNMDKILAPYQNRFIALCRLACLALIYGADLSKYAAEIMAEAGVTELMRLVLCECPRRMGKTTMAAMWIASISCYIPGMASAIFSVGGRTSEKMLADILHEMTYIPGAWDRIVKKKSDELLCIAEEPVPGTARGSNPEAVFASTTSKIYCYPATVRGTRGFTVKLIMVDEAAHIDPELFYQSILPALTTTNQVLIAITTAETDVQFFTNLMKAKNTATGKDIFCKLRISLTCDACNEAGLIEHCVHNRHLLPAWKPLASQQMAKDILMAAGREGVYMRELLGTSPDDKVRVFYPADVSRFTCRFLPVESEPLYIWSFIDPHGGGSLSSQAIIDIAFDKGRVMVRALSHSSNVHRSPTRIAYGWRDL